MPFYQPFYQPETTQLEDGRGGVGKYAGTSAASAGRDSCLPLAVRRSQNHPSGRGATGDRGLLEVRGARVAHLDARA